MKTKSSDTHPEVERRHIELLQQAGPAKRLALTLSLCQSTLDISRQGLRRRYPDLSEQERALLLLELCHGKELARRVRIYLDGRKTV